MVDATEYLLRVKPTAKRGKLAAHWSAIDTLRENGCTLEQVRVFLSENGVEISIPGLSKAIKRRKEKGGKQASTPDAKQPASRPVTGEGKTETNGADAQEQSSVDDAETNHLSTKQRRERHASKFVDSAATNPLINRIKEK